MHACIHIHTYIHITTYACSKPRINLYHTYMEEGKEKEEKEKKIWGCAVVFFFAGRVIINK